MSEFNRHYLAMLSVACLSLVFTTCLRAVVPRQFECSRYLLSAYQTIDHNCL